MAWPGRDLWNLMPADPPRDRYLKRAWLPSAAILRQARSRILRWWEKVYLVREDAVPQRSAEEAYVAAAQTCRRSRSSCP